MRWVMRVLTVGTASAIVACAAIAGLEDPSPGGADDGGGSLQDTNIGSSGDVAAGDTSVFLDGNTTSDAPGDAPADVVTSDGCTLGQDKDPCTKGGDCCSAKCNEARQCAGSCKAQGSGCDPTSTTSCCVQLWCSNFQCAPCITGGNDAAQPAGFPLASSCCSRSLQTFDPSKCQ